MVILAIPVLLSYLQSLTGPISTSLLMICLSEIGCRWLEIEFEEDLVAVEINKLEIISRLPSKGEIYFGGGWNISPKSSLQDGLFNIQVFAVTKLKAMQIFFLAKKGLHLKESSVKLKRLSQLTVNSKDPIEIDGDFFGYGPAEIFIKKRAIRFKI